MISDKVIALFCEMLSVSEDEISEATKLTGEYGFEPIDIARLVIAAEERFRITIHDEDISLFKNVGDMIKYIQEKLPEPDFVPEQLIYESSRPKPSGNKN